MLRIKNVLLIASLAAMMTSCSNKATEEQMKMLGDLDRQRDQLKMDLQRAQDNLRDAQSKLSQQDRDLADCNTDTQSATRLMATWPNVWADSVDWRMAPVRTPESMETRAQEKREHMKIKHH